MNFKDKVVLVTGGSSGIGAAIAIKFAEHGANVAIVGRNEIKLRAVSEKCKECGSKPLVIVAEATKDEDLRKCIADTIKHYNKLDILVNSVGIAGTKSILADNAIEVFDKMMTTNLRSAVFLTNIAVPYLVETKGNIINIGSIGGSSVLIPGNFSYCVSKAGLEHFTKCIALELAKKGVRVNVINPGPVKTDFMDNIGADEESVTQNKFWDAVTKGTALGKVSYPEEIADLAIYLASDKARSITGASCVIDNGVLLKGLLDL